MPNDSECTCHLNPTLTKAGLRAVQRFTSQGASWTSRLPRKPTATNGRYMEAKSIETVPSCLVSQSRQPERYRALRAVSA